MAFTDVLIDDFEGGSTRNLLGWDWYYFTDVKDDGNSRILNAELLPKGNYTAFRPDTQGYESDFCAKIEYVLGDTQPITLNSWGPDAESYCNFVGIGTDLARPGGITDLRTATGVSFRARSSDSIIIFFELVTSTIYDFGYYRSYFLVTDVWQQYTVEFSNTSLFMFPKNEYTIEEHPLDLDRVQKMNWEVPRCFMSIDGPWWVEDYYCFSDSGCLYIDDVKLIRPATPVTGGCPVPQKTVPFKMTTAGDLLGRRFPSLYPADRASGIYWLKSSQSNPVNVLRGKE